MGHIADVYERTQERIGQLLDERRVYLRDSSLRKIPQDHFYAAIALAGGEAYTEDIVSILNDQFGYNIESTEDVKNILDVLSGVEWEFDKKIDKSYWKLNKKFSEANREHIESSMKKTMGYETKKGLDALFAPQTEKKLDLWSNYRG
jgi:hypothetical protein